MWNTDSLHAGLHGISFPSIVSLFTSTLCAFASFYLSVVTWSQSLQCRRGDSDGCGSLTPTPLCNIRWEKKNQKRFLTCLFWQCTKECFALAFIPACMFAETRGAQAFPISDPIKHHCGVTRGPNAGVLSSRKSRPGYGSPLKETSGWGCDHSLWWKTLPSSVFLTK